MISGAYGEPLRRCHRCKQPKSVLGGRRAGNTRIPGQDRWLCADCLLATIFGPPKPEGLKR